MPQEAREVQLQKWGVGLRLSGNMAASTAQYTVVACAELGKVGLSFCMPTVC